MDIVSCVYTGNMWIGKLVCDVGDSGELDNIELTWSQMEEIKQKVETKISGVKCKLYTGTYGC